MTPTQIVARVRAQPKSLYWRLRLVRALETASSRRAAIPRIPRALVLESCFMLRRADPEAPISSASIQRWSLAEARRWVRLIRRESTDKTWLKRAWELRAMAGRPRRASLLREARAALEHVSRAQWRRHAVAVASLLFETDLETFERQIPTLIADHEDWQLTKLAVEWLTSGRLSPKALEALRQFLSKVPANLLDGHSRLRLLEFEANAALERRDLEPVARILRRMAEVVPATAYPGNYDSVVTALAERGALRTEALAYVDAVLQKDWRTWVRPKFEKLRAQLSTMTPPEGTAP